MTSDRRPTGEPAYRPNQRLEPGQSRWRTVAQATDVVGEERQPINGEWHRSSEGLENRIEELQAVNSELKAALETVSRAHHDLQRLLAATDIGTLFIDSRLRIRCFTEHITDLFGISAVDDDRPISDVEQTFDYAELLPDVQAVLAEGEQVRREVRSSAGRWFDVRLRPCRSPHDTIDGVVISFTDITDRKQVEERQQMLLDDLTHRFKNALAVVQSIANQTLRNTHSAADFVDRFGGRLAALASAHGLLVRSQWQGADFASLIRLQLDAHNPEGAARIELAGPPISLPADLATPFGLVVHELAANAAKYGALSQLTGKVAIRWETEVQDDRRMFAVEWRETGGPPVQEPESRGFGGTLIEKGIPGATVSRAFEPGGIVCSIRLPLPDAQNEPHSSGT